VVTAAKTFRGRFKRHSGGRKLFSYGENLSSAREKGMHAGEKFFWLPKTFFDGENISQVWRNFSQTEISIAELTAGYCPTGVFFGSALRLT